MIDIEYRVGMAKKCFDSWEREQDTTATRHYMYVEDFFSFHMYNEVADLKHEPSDELGELIKRLYELAEHELERVYEAEQQNMLPLLAKCNHWV